MMGRFCTYLLFCLVALPFGSPAQKQAVIRIVHSDYGRMNKNGTYRLIGNVKLSHKDLVMTCDSLYQYPDSNYIEAFGRVHVIQNDTLNMWGDFVTYNGNTELAKVRNNVMLKDPKITLTTDFLDYDAAGRIGHYFNSGTIRDSVNTLVSDVGYYYSFLNELFFKDSVKVVSPDYTLYSDTLKYQTVTKYITILGPTNVYGKDRRLYSENGWYSTLDSHAELYRNNRLYYGTYNGSADTLVVDSISGSAIMRQNIHLHDTVNNIIIGGNYGEVLKNNDFAFVTRRALLTLVGQNDSLFVHGDTLSLSKDSLGNNVMKAYYNTKFYSSQLQGLCDSMSFPVADSTVYLSSSPVVWADGNQMTANTVNMHISNNKVDQFQLLEKAMIVNPMDPTMYRLQQDQTGQMYNQIKGRNMTGFIRRNQLQMVVVDGNGEAIYYPDDQGVIIGLNRATSSSIRIELKDKKITDITFIRQPEGTLNPLLLVKPEDQLFEDFQWHINYRPAEKEDIYRPGMPGKEKKDEKKVAGTGDVAGRLRNLLSAAEGMEAGRDSLGSGDLKISLEDLKVEGDSLSFGGMKVGLEEVKMLEDLLESRQDSLRKPISPDALRQVLKKGLPAQADSLLKLIGKQGPFLKELKKP